ncbi:MAG: hypothetical protein RIQ60_1175 [Pseudomonadota bacterium]|jgi:pimeloyl-ACP methyl ester carboxylesterase
MNVERLRRRTLQRAGVTLSLYDAGPGGQPVLFQHGLCGSAQQTAEALPETDELRLLTLECRGHGASPAGALEALSIATFADDLIAAIEQEALAPLVLGGISMGAAISLRIAALRPELVRGLILARPAWLTEAAPANMQPNAEVGELLAEGDPEQARRRFEASPTARRLAAEAPDNLASLLGFFARVPQSVTSALLQRIAADGPGVGAEQLCAIRCPALVIGHAADSVHPLSLARELAGLLPRGEFVEITPKSVSRAAYVDDMHRAILRFTRSVAP